MAKLKKVSAKCPTCGGRGYKAIYDKPLLAPYSYRKQTCTRCGGSGVVRRAL